VFGKTESNEPVRKGNRLYWPSKPTEAIARLKEDPRVRNAVANLEPYNGWVIRIYPEFMDISDLAEADGAEIINYDLEPATDKTAPPKVTHSASGGGGGRSSSGPNLRKAEEHKGWCFRLNGSNYRKEGTDGWKALEYVKERPWCSAEEIATAGNYMQHIDYDWKKKGIIERRQMD
jgi:hypothetical protein